MDEIVIDEKKYVSSKRAAKSTGYAKDYIGQLCREGRVPARLVGRSWYILESALHDHRFGTAQQTKPASHNRRTLEKVSPQPHFNSTWDEPRYEAIADEAISTIDHNVRHSYTPEAKHETVMRLEKTWSTLMQEKSVETPIQDTVGISDVEHSTETHTPLELGQPLGTQEEMTSTNREIEPNIPQAQPHEPPKELLPQRNNADRPDRKIDDIQGTTPIKSHTYRGVRFVAIVLALFSVGVAVAGTGRLDSLLSSHPSLQSFLGVTVVTK